MKLKKWQKRAIRQGLVTLRDWEKLKEQTYRAGANMAADAEKHGGIEAVNRKILKALKRLNRLRFGRIPQENRPRRELETKLKDLD